MQTGKTVDAPKTDVVASDSAIAMAKRLKRQGYRGAICGPADSGKSDALNALGEALLTHGLTPLPLSLQPDQAGTLPKHWRRVIKAARPTDALLLDGYDQLPRWAKAWVWLATFNAGAIVVTTQRRTVYTALNPTDRAEPHAGPSKRNAAR